MKSDGKVVISTALDNKGLEKGLGSITGSLGGLTKTVTKTAAVITTAFATAAVAITKQSVEAYAEYEQLAGGVETLFKNSASKVKAYAEDAFYTAGVSANKYMETVTSFSASLISSLGGDTEKAADVANMAMIDMSDNANKMGTAIENIQNAYQGFAKQNYTMLDNLKLGYGGTKTEMERLLKDAQALTGVKYDISNLSDVYSAIHVIQEELGIAGTTAKEAEKTITGAGNMTKAAWKNVLAAISGGGDLDKAINNLVYSISKYFENIVPVAERALSGIGQLIEKIAPQLVQSVATALIKALPSLLNAVYQMIVGLANGIYQGIVALFTGSDTSSTVSAQLSEVAESANAAADAEENLAAGITEASKAAKKSLAGFDELNVLQNDAVDESSVSSATSGSVGDSIAIDVIVSGEVQDDITPKTKTLFKKIKSFCEEIKTTLQPSIDAWGEAFSSLGPAVENSGSRISAAWTTLKNESLVPFGEYVTTDFVPSMVNTFSTTFAPIFADVMPAAMDIWTTDFENGCLIVQAATEQLTTAFGGVKKAFSDMCESISTNWDTYGGKLLRGLTDFKDGLWKTWWYIHDNIIDPVTTACSETLTWLWDEHLKPLWDDIVEFVLSVSENILALWNGFLKPVIDWVVGVLAPLVVSVIKTIVDAVGIVIAVVSDVVGGVLTFLDGLIQFIAGVFTLDWDRTWGGIVKIFEGVFGLIEGIVKGVVNAVIWILNALVGAIYSAVAGIVNGLGGIVNSIGDMIGQNWGFSIPTDPPQIPYLAQGAVLPANKPFLAMVGDQKHGTNIEAPLSTIQEAVALVMEDQVAAMMTGFEALLEENRLLRQIVENIEVGDTTIGAAAQRYNSKMRIARGGY